MEKIAPTSNMAPGSSFHLLENIIVQYMKSDLNEIGSLCILYWLIFDKYLHFYCIPYVSVGGCFNYMMYNWISV